MSGISNSFDDAEQGTRSNLGVARYDQPPISSGASSSTTSLSTFSHAHSYRLSPSKPSASSSALPLSSSNLQQCAFAYQSSMQQLQNSNDPVLHRAPESLLGSLYSYDSTRDLPNFLRQLHGRTFNSLNEAYILPSDETEWERLDKQHSALYIGMDGLSPCMEELDAILAPGGEQKHVADFGCGTGTWAIQMATKYPHVTVLGVDVAPTPVDQSLFPPNLTFEIDDINLGLTHFHGQFDVIHMRCVNTGITDIDRTFVDLQQCLKPGGLLIIVDGDIWIGAEDKETVVKNAKVEGDGDVSGVSEDGSWFRRFMFEINEASKLAGSSLERGREKFAYGLWDQPMMDPSTAFGGGVYLPLGPWARGQNQAENDALLYAGILMRQNILKVHRAFHSMFLRFGMDQATLDEWSQRADEELTLMRPRTWVRFRFCWARKRAESGGPAPVLSSIETLETDPEGKPKRTIQRRPRTYPAIEIWDTREESVYQWNKRKGTMGEQPPSFLQRAWRQKQAKQQS